MGSTFATVGDDSDVRWQLITLRLTPTLIFTQSTGYEKSWRYLYKAGEVQGPMCENVPAIDTLTVIVCWPIQGIQA